MPISIFDSNSVLPFCAVSSRATSSSRASSRSAALKSIRPRFRAERSRQPADSKHAFAARTAFSTSAASPAATSASFSSVAGFSTGKCFPDVAGRHSFLLVRRNSFFGVLTLEELLLQLPLDRERRLERNLGTRLDGALDQAHSLRRLVGRAELFGIEEDLLPEVLGREDLVHEPDFLGAIE